MRYYVVNVWLKNGRRLCWNVEPILMPSYPRCFIHRTGKVSCADLNVGKSNIPQQAVGQGKNLRLQKSEIRSRSIAYWTSAFPHKQISQSWPFLLIICYATMNFSSFQLFKWKNVWELTDIPCRGRPSKRIFRTLKMPIWFAVEYVSPIILLLASPIKILTKQHTSVRGRNTGNAFIRVARGNRQSVRCVPPMAA